jgi:hypothetical protein
VGRAVHEAVETSRPRQRTVRACTCVAPRPTSAFAYLGDDREIPFAPLAARGRLARASTVRSFRPTPRGRTFTQIRVVNSRWSKGNLDSARNGVLNAHRRAIRRRLWTLVGRASVRWVLDPTHLTGAAAKLWQRAEQFYRIGLLFRG